MAYLGHPYYDSLYDHYHTLTDIGGGGFPWVDPGSDEDHLAASAVFKVLGRGDSEKVKTTLLL